VRVKDIVGPEYVPAGELKNTEIGGAILEPVKAIESITLSVISLGLAMLAFLLKISNCLSSLVLLRTP
jgi:hypothetical protein